MRHIAVVVGALLSAALPATLAAAEPASVGAPMVRAVVETPVEALHPVTTISPFLFLNRCKGGCVVHGGNNNDARMQQTSIPAAGDYNVQEFTDQNGATGAAADADWAAVVKCMQDVYSPYAITVTDVQPAESYNEAIIAGQPGDIGRPIDNLGVAPIAANCAPQDDVISFSFANHHPGANTVRIQQICWTAAQESAHAYGLDHEYVFTDGGSTCNDPMTYRNDCGGEKFFRYARAQCGEDVARQCRCGGTQNSHASLLKVFGPGTPTTALPHATIILPPPGSLVVPGTVVHANSGAQRGVAKVQLMINGSRWAVAAGAPFGPDGQPDADYTLPIPSAVPQSTLDLVVQSVDDLGIAGSSPMITVTKGAACTSASGCLPDQSCDDGRCHYDAPAGVLGDECPYDQFCQSWECVDTGDAGKRCVVDCEVDEPTSCPASFTCADAGGGHGLCVQVSGGCCSVGRGSSPWPAAVLSLAVFGLLIRRRR